MNKPKIAQGGPYEIEIAEGKKYAWCACGLSNTQPFCDGSHKGGEFSPVIFKAEKNGKVAFCGCKHSKNPPFCDGAHSTLKNG